MWQISAISERRQQTKNNRSWRNEE
jgi:hypothetical protein